MIMADVLLGLLIVLGSYLVIISYWLLATALFPRMVERCESRYAERPVRTVLAGVLVVVPLLVLSTAMGKTGLPGLKLLALILGLLPVLGGLLGSAGFARRVGSGLPTARDEAEPWRKVWRGGLVLGFTFLLPIIGWFFVLPLTLASGCGALLLARPHRVKAAAEAPVPSAL